MLGEVNGEACRSYRKKRRNRGGARRDLEDLRAAIGHHAAEGYHREIVKVSLPEKGEPRDKWLTRSDAAKLIWTCWRYREMQKRSRRPTDDVKAPTAKRPLRHLARFILLGNLQRDARGSDRCRIADSSGRPLLCRPRARTLLPPQTGQRENQQAPTDGPNSVAPACASAALAPDRSGGKALRRVQWQAGKFSQDSIQERRQARRARSRHIASYVAAHGGDLADAEGRGSVAGRRLSWNVA